MVPTGMSKDTPLTATHYTTFALCCVLHPGSALQYKAGIWVFLKDESLNTRFNNQKFSFFFQDLTLQTSPHNCQNHFHRSQLAFYQILFSPNTSEKQHYSTGEGTRWEALNEASSRSS